MPASTLSALSPLDGRYAAKVAALRPLLSEFGLMHRRVQVEVEWFIALSDAGLDAFAPLAAGTRARRCASASTRSRRPTPKRSRRSSAPPTTTSRRSSTGCATASPTYPELAGAESFIHFACTSEDINNTSHALMLKAARADVLLPALDGLVARLAAMARDARRHRDAEPHARPDGEPDDASARRSRTSSRASRAARAKVAQVELLAKMNGAVGNYNAHLAACPEFDWPALARLVVEDRLGLRFNPYTMQIEPHDAIAELFDALVRTHTILIDLARDIWGYVSLGYFKQRTVAGEIGSSTMPHKVNPIDFENAEGNLGLANALLTFMSQKLPISRFQRDLTDSTVLRNMGVALGHAVLGVRLARARPRQARGQPRRARRPTSTPPGKCSPSRSRR